MKQWSLFLISIGCVLIMLSYMMPNPILLILSGLILAIAGAVKLKTSRK